MTEVLHHHHHHKKSPNKKDWIHKEKWKNTIDRSVYAISLFGIVMTLPQLYNVWVAENIEGVSLISWAWYSFSASIWVLYGIAHNERPIIIINICWTLVQLLIVFGIVLN